MAQGILIALSGLSASGKSTLAGQLKAHFPDAIHCQSDAIRKALFNVAPTDKLPESAYSPQATARTYKRFYQEVQQALNHGKIVISDGVCARREERKKLEQHAEAAGALFAGVWLWVELKEAVRRADHRRNDTSDATADIVRQQRIFDVEGGDWPAFDTGQGYDAVFHYILDTIHQQRTQKRKQQMIKSILTPLHSVDMSETLLDASHVLAQHFNAHVQALHVHGDPKAVVPLFGEGMTGVMIEELMEAAEKEQTKRRRAIRDDYLAKIESKKWVEKEAPDGCEPTIRWIDEEGREDEVIAHYGRLSDLIILPKPLVSDDIYSALAINAALFETGRPMMLIPQKTLQVMPKKGVICWNGSMEGARAVAAALPLLQALKQVTILTVETKDTTKPYGENLKTYLKLHGITATTDFITQSADTVAETVLDYASKNQADMMVMGGYSHSRMRELILGGVTRHILEHSHLPVVMGH